MNVSTHYLAKSFLFIIAVVFIGCQKDEDNSDRIPEVFTGSVENMDCTTAEVGGSFITGINTEVSSFGFCYSTNQNPTIADSISKGNQFLVTVNETFREETFTSQITGLKPKTTYYLKASIRSGLRG